LQEDATRKPLGDLLNHPTQGEVDKKAAGAADKVS
jgi:hypothetical protein